MLTLAARLDHILTVCGFPSPAAFTKAVGESPQQWRNWRKRNSVGRADTKIHTATGVDILWLKTGEGTEPFPNGAKQYTAENEGRPDLDLRLTQAEYELDQAGLVIAQLLQAVADKTPGVAADLAARLRLAQRRLPHRSVLLELAVDAAETSLRAQAGLRRVAEPAAPTPTPGRTGR